MVDKTIACIILAAGRGTRMKSERPKILHKIAGRPMIDYVIGLAKSLCAHKIIVVLGYKHDEAKKEIKEKVDFVVQKSLLGSGDAINQAKTDLADFDGDVVVLYGDAPLIKAETLKRLLDAHKNSKNSCTLLTTFLKDPTGYGRVLRNESGKVLRIVEENEASIFEKAIEEINVGTICCKSKELFKALSEVKNNNKKKEFFLTDAIGLISKSNKKIGTVSTDDKDEISGINSRIDLSVAEGIMKKRILNKIMLEGVTIIDPDTTFISDGAKVGIDTIIYPNTVIASDVKIGKDCKIGPFARIRSGTSVGDNVEIGNFVELTRTKLGNNTKVKHLSYLGDTEVGSFVNIGAGTIVANYDGKIKSKTTIDDQAFIGSGTILIAPVKIGKRAVTGAGAVITKNKNVPDDAVVVGIPAKVLKKKNSFKR